MKMFIFSLLLWIDTNCNGIRTDQEALKRASLAPVVLDEQGFIVSGVWVCPFTEAVMIDVKDLELRHLVPWCNVEDSGGYFWPEVKKSIYLNDLSDPRQILAVLKYFPEQIYTYPESKKFRCRYANTFIYIKNRWGLSVSNQEHIIYSRYMSYCTPEDYLYGNIEEIFGNPFKPKPDNHYIKIPDYKCE